MKTVKLLFRLMLLLLIGMHAKVQAQFIFTTNNDGSLNIYRYTGGGTVVIPSTTNGLPVTSIGFNAFEGCQSLTSITIPNSVTSIGVQAFDSCTTLKSVNIPDSVISLGDNVFFQCRSLTTVKIGNSVNRIGRYAFFECSKLASITIGNSVTSIGNYAFSDCYGLNSVVIPASVASIGGQAFYETGLWSVYFAGNAPSIIQGSGAFGGVFPTVYCLPGTTGWDDFSANTGLLPTPWLLPNPTILDFEPNFGVQANEFGFTVSWATNLSVVVEACTNLANPVWNPVSTNTLTGGTAYFCDSQWTNYPGRFYRLCSP